MKTKSILRYAPLVVGAMMAVPACAQLALESNGYFRVGPQASSKNANRSCYGLTGGEFKYRLGNECELYGEFLFTGTIKQATGENIKIRLMPNIANSNASDAGDSKLGMAQMYAEVGGLDFAPTASFWAGKRYHRGADVHIVDKFFEQLDGTGAGTSLDALGGKLDLAFYRSDSSTKDANGNYNPGNRLNAWLRDAPVNAGGTVNVLLNVTNGDFDGGKSGMALSLRHTQSGVMGGSNNIWFQASQGSAGLTGNFGTLTNGSDVKKWRLADGYQFQLNDAFGGQAIAMYQSNKSNAGDSTISSLGGRVSYAFTRNFKLLTELGIDRVAPKGGATANLTKLTIAPTLSAGKGFWDRPELRFYVTTAKWNQAANDAANNAYNAANSTTGSTFGLSGVGANKTSGTSYGVQAEIWW
jgi:maltoporin